MKSFISSRPSVFLFGAALIGLATTASWAGLREGSQTADGLTVYLGIVPAAIVRGHAKAHVETKMHGGVPAASLNNVHIVAAVFDAASGTRQTDLRVVARLHGRGTKRWTIPLTSMTINGAKTFGGYTSLGQEEEVMISIDVLRPSRTLHKRTTTLQFEYSND